MRFLGPFEIVRCLGKGMYELMEDGNARRVNGAHLKFFRCDGDKCDDYDDHDRDYGDDNDDDENGDDADNAVSQLLSVLL